MLCACALLGPKPPSAASSSSANGSAQSQQQGGDEPDIYTPRAWLYRVPMGDSTKIVDEQGVVVFESADDVTIIYDNLTGEQRYISVVRQDILDDAPDYGPAIQYTHQLYDLEGALLYDFLPGRIAAAWEHYVQINDYTGHAYSYSYENGATHSYVVDCATGRTVLEHQASIVICRQNVMFADYSGTYESVISDIYAYKLDLTPSFTLLSSDGAIWYRYAYSAGVANGIEYFRVDRANGTCGLIDENGKIVIDYAVQSIAVSSYGYISVCANDHSRFINLYDGTTVCEIDGFIRGYTGKYLVVSKEENPTDYDAQRMYLADLDGNKISGDFEYISSDSQDMYGFDYDPYYLNARSLFGNYGLLDSEGQPFLPGGDSDHRYGSLYTRHNRFMRHNEGGSSSMVDEQGRVLTERPYEHITSLYMASDNYLQRKQLPFFYGNYMAASNWLYEVFGIDGKPLISNIKLFFDAGPDRLVVAKGFKIGLMDYGGNWIASWDNFGFLDDENQYYDTI